MKELSELQKGILKRALNGNEQTYEEVCRRVSTYLEGGETLYETMLNGEFLPAMPCLMNAGTDHPQLSACFVIPTEDSLESIMQSATEMALTFKSGGGVGFNLSFIRPKGSPVGSTGGTSPSIVEWMKMFNSVADAVKNGARRRGALMVCCNFWNPNIIDFINSKRVDGELSNMNISVIMTDSDFEAIDNDAKHPSGRTSKQVWNLIVTRAWEKAEPGLLFLDRAQRDDPRVYGTNPCFSYDTRILTRDGYKVIGEMIGEEVDVWNGEEFSTVKPFVAGFNQKLYRCTFSNGTFVDCTADHKWFTTEGKVTTSELLGKKLIKCKMPAIEGSEVLQDAYAYGFFCGDGSETIHNGNQIYIYPPKAICFGIEVPKSGFKTIQVPLEWSKTFVPDARYTLESRREWLAGLIDADGTASEGSYQICSVDRDFLIRTLEMLNTIGATGKVTICKPECDKVIKGKICHCKPCYRLLIARGADLQLSCKRVHINSGNRGASRFVTCDSIEELEGEHTVFCLTEPKRHQIVANANPSSQCGEQWLPPYGNCNLGSVNLSACIENGRMSYVKLKRISEIGARALWVACQKNELPLPQMMEENRRHPRIGLGVVGLAEAFIKCGVRYGTPESCELAKHWLGTIRNSAKKVVMNDCEAVLSIAPTGSLSTLMGTSSGIEPYFAFVTKRHIMDKDWIEVAECYENAPDKSVCVTAYDVTPEEHIAVLAACQCVVDNSISKTINMPQNSSKEDVGRIYRMAWEMGCKGVTIYREGSRFAPLESLKPEDIYVCPECGHKQLRQGAHCIACQNCGYQQCG